MKSIAWLLAGALLSGCASLGIGGGNEPDEETWAMAHQALAVQDFDRAAALFQRLATEHPDGQTGKEAVFFLGSMRLDPRNPAWNSGPAEELLREYISYDSIAGTAVVGRRPEAEILLQLAVQLNMPPLQRVPALQPEVVIRPQRVIVPASESRQLSAEVAQLRRELATRDSTIQTQREELERIRRTLTGRDPGSGVR